MKKQIVIFREATMRNATSPGGFNDAGRPG